MDDRQLTFKEDEITRMLNRAFDHFRDGSFEEAERVLEEALEIDFDYPDVASSLKCASYWRETAKALEETGEPYERGEMLMGAWSHFLAFVERIGGTSEKGLFAIKQFVFRSALEDYTSLADDGSIYQADILLRIGRCHKELGRYDDAIGHLEQANQLKNGVPAILAELADCYSLVGEIRAGKIFFREAFFVEPQEIDLTTLESVAIQRLMRTVREMGLSDRETREWIPVYGTVYGVFNVKRELRPVEYGKLRQSIYRMEHELQGDSGDKESIVPRLLNHYFWLIDHYAATGEERSKIEEVLEKIKDLEPAIYQEYTK
jgi:tetratricopeptide (TPR) repeat protein